LLDLYSMISAFSIKFRDYVTSAEEHKSLVHNCRPAFDDFKKRIQDTAPVFVPQKRLAPLRQRVSVKDLEGEVDGVRLWSRTLEGALYLDDVTVEIDL
jgi:hypothetical protein